MPTESTISFMTGAHKSVFSMVDKMDDTEIADLPSEKSAADPVLPDSCDYDPDKSEDTPAGAAQPAAQVDPPADTNGIETRVESLDGLGKSLQDMGPGAHASNTIGSKRSTTTGRPCESRAGAGRG